ncbi:hypothetical protein ACFLT2_06135 [Acidobacteriota bacterium]
MQRKISWKLFTIAVLLIVGMIFSGPSWALEESTQGEPALSQSEEEASAESEGGQDAESKALDSTATQWSFQLAYQKMADYHQDTLDNGKTRPAGMDDYIQLRIVAPLPMKGLTLLPRLTFRHYQNPQGQSGMGNTELFVLIIPKSLDWGTGRMGIGPLITMPGNENVARKDWGYGFAAAIVNGSGPWFYGLLFTQSWRSIDPNALPPGKSTTNPLGIAPFLNYRLGGGWYVGNGDMVALYDWDSKKVFLPIGIRIGKVIVLEKGSWNIYAEYQTSAIYKDWGGSAVKNSFRINVTYTMPVG